MAWKSFQLLNLIFDPCVIILKHPYISLLISPTASECKNSSQDVLAYKSFACEKFWPHFEKQNGCHSQLFENHELVLYLEILQLAKSNLHKRYMARKATMIVI